MVTPKYSINYLKHTKLLSIWAIANMAELKKVNSSVQRADQNGQFGGAERLQCDFIGLSQCEVEQPFILLSNPYLYVRNCVNGEFMLAKPLPFTQFLTYDNIDRFTTLDGRWKTHQRPPTGANCTSAEVNSITLCFLLIILYVFQQIFLL